MRRGRKTGATLLGLLSVLMIIGILSGTMHLTVGAGKPQAGPPAPEASSGHYLFSSDVGTESVESSADEAMPSGKLVVLVHGFAKKRDDMEFLEKGLSKRGYEVFSVNLPTTFDSVEDCSRSMASQLSRIIPKYRRVDFVTHSMGALITRTFLQAHPLDTVGRCVFIAPPHNGSAIGDVLNRVPLYSTVFKPVRDFRTDSGNLGDDLYLLPDSVDVGIIAGSKNDMAAGRLLLSPESDGRVEVESTRCADMKEWKILPYNHHKIHHNRETLEAVDSFLRRGTFGS